MPNTHLLFTDWFTPGYRAGGPIQSAHNFALGMQRHYAIKVLSSDRDLDALAPYAGIESNVWLPFQQSGVEVLYAARVPVIISDQTPWQSLREREVGWSLPLNRAEGFAEAVQEAMSVREYARWSAQAQGYAQDFVREARLEEAYQELFS